MASKPGKVESGEQAGGTLHKLKHFLGLGKGTSAQVGTVRPPPREFLITPETIKEISAGSPANHRVKTIKELCDVVQTRRLEENAVEVLWTAIKDMLRPQASTEDRHLAFRFLQSLIRGQYDQLGAMRAHFFYTIRAHTLLEDLPQRLDLFCELSRNGKDLLYIEEESGTFLLEWMKDIISSKKIDEFLGLLINVVKFNAAYLDEDIIAGFVLNTCLIATRTGKEEDIGLCLQFLDTVICYSYLPAQSLHHFIVCLCRVVNIEKFCQGSWTLMRKLLGTHLGHGGIYHMCCILQDKAHVTESGAGLLRGAVFFIGMALWGSKKVASLKHPPSAVLLSFLQGLENSNSPIVAYEIVVSLTRLIHKYGREQQVTTWDILLDIIDALLRHVESVQKPNTPTLVASIHEMLTAIEELHESGHFNCTPHRFFAIIETCATKRPETSILALVSHKAQSITPSHEGWIQSLYHLVDKYFKQEGRTRIRCKVLDVLSYVLSVNKHSHEDELIELVVLPHLAHIENDPDLEVRKRAAQLMIDLTSTCQSLQCQEILILIQKLINKPMAPSTSSSPIQIIDGSDLPTTLLESRFDDVMTAINGLISVFQMKLYHQPSTHVQNIFELLVSHVCEHYPHENMIRGAGCIRVVVFNWLLDLRADGVYRVGCPSKDTPTKIVYSPYVQCASSELGEYQNEYRRTSVDTTTAAAAVRSSPSVIQLKTVEIEYALAFTCITTCLEKERDWRVLEPVLLKLPMVLRNKSLIMVSLPEDMERFCARLCDMVSNKGLALPERLMNTPFKFSKSDFHSYIFPVLTCLVTYISELDKKRQMDLVRCLEFGLVSKKARICVHALSVCSLEIQDIMMRQLPSVLLRLSQISATVAMAIPLMEFLSSLIRLPQLYANFVEEQYMSVFAIALPYTNPFKYSHYTVSLAYHVISMWFLKCKLPFRKRFVSYIIKGLRSNVLRQFEETTMRRQNQDSSERARTHSLNDDTAKSDRYRAFSMNDERLRKKAAIARARAQGLAPPSEKPTSQRASHDHSATFSHPSTSTSTTPAVSSTRDGDENMMQFHRELMETCIDAMARYTFSTCASMPKRSSVSEFLLAGGQKQSWLLGNRIITITTSGGAKVNRTGLCDNCVIAARIASSDKPPQQEETQPSPSVGRKRHKSAAVPRPMKQVALKPSSQDDILLHKHSPESGSVLETRSDTSLLNGNTSSSEDISGSAKDRMRKISIGTKEEKMQMVDNVLMGLKARPSDKSIFSVQACNCWCTLWAEIHIRRATGNLSWMMRIQNEQDLSESFPDFPLTDISSLFLAAPDDTEGIQERRKIDSMSLGENEYDLLLDEHFPESSDEGDMIPKGRASTDSEKSEKIDIVDDKEKTEKESTAFCKSSSSPDLAPVEEETHSPATSPSNADEGKPWQFISEGSNVEAPPLSPHRRQAVVGKPFNVRSNTDPASTSSWLPEELPKSNVEKESTAPASTACVVDKEKHVCDKESDGHGKSDNQGCDMDVIVPLKESHNSTYIPMTSLRQSKSMDAAPATELQPLIPPQSSISKLAVNAPRSNEQPKPLLLSQPSSPPPGSKPLSPSSRKHMMSRQFAFNRAATEDGDIVPSDRDRAQTISYSSPRSSPKVMRASSMTEGRRRPLSLDSSLLPSLSITGKEPSHGGVSPSFLFLQLYHSNLLDAGQGRPLELPNSEVVKRAVKMLDFMYPYETHKIGVLYVAAGQAKNETAILANRFGSSRYVTFLQSLGHLLRLTTCIPETTYVGGLDLRGGDGEYAYAWHDDFMQVIFHVATLMPNKESDPSCNQKKLHIGNNFVAIVYNDSGEEYKIGTIKCQFNYVNIIITPLDHGINTVTLQTSQDVGDAICQMDTTIISDNALAPFVRQMAVHANLASVILQRQKSNPKDPYASNWLERLRKIKSLRQKIIQEQDRGGDKPIASAIVEDFTDFV